MIALTIDCEQWNPLIGNGPKKGEGNTDFSREGNLQLLKLLDEFNIKVTFFVTGYFAEKEPEHVKYLYSKGHEIASHGYCHFYRGNSNLNLKEDISQSKQILERTINDKVVGFRAPNLQFSLELIKNLYSLGFKYDSSLHPTYLPSYYNNLRYPIYPHQPIKDLDVLEFPLGVMPLTRLPIGWIWMRNFGSFWSTIGTKQLLKRGIVPVIYIHSWEFTKLEGTHAYDIRTRNTGKKFCSIISNFLNNFKDEEFITLGSQVK